MNLLLIDCPDEVWVPIQGFEDAYQVSNMGRVRSVPRIRKNGVGYRRVSGKIIRPSRSSRCRGYLAVHLSLCSKVITTTVHKLVAAAFISNPLVKPMVNHKDGNKLNNHVGNLEWVTARENGEHAARLGLMCKGSEIPQAKLTERKVAIIKKELRKGTRAIVLSRRFDVNVSTIYYIKRGDTWSHVQ
jgi:hypothetical protein